MQPGEIKTTYADISSAQEHLGFNPKTSLEEGMEHFLDWCTNSANVLAETNQ